MLKIDQDENCDENERKLISLLINEEKKEIERKKAKKHWQFIDNQQEQLEFAHCWFQLGQKIYQSKLFAKEICGLIRSYCLDPSYKKKVLNTFQFTFDPLKKIYISFNPLFEFAFTFRRINLFQFIRNENDKISFIRGCFFCLYDNKHQTTFVLKQKLIKTYRLMIAIKICDICLVEEFGFHPKETDYIDPIKLNSDSVDVFVK